MALRARELYYFVRIGNYASRPLRQLEADFHRLGASGDAAASRLERLQIQQKRLASSIALRQATIPALKEVNILRTQERQAALQRANIALASKRAAINTRIAASETKIDQSIARGNILERERVILEEKQAAASLRARQALGIQQARVASQITQAARSQAMIPAQRKIAQLETARARAQRTVISPLLTPGQRQRALAGNISRSPDVAKLQARYIAAEKAIQQAALAMARLDASEASLGERQAVLATSAQRLVAAETELKIATQQQALALEKLDQKQIDNTVQTDRYRREIQGLTEQLQLLVSEERRLSLSQRQSIADGLAAAASIAQQNAALADEVVQLERVNRALAEQQAMIRRQRWDKIALTGRAIADFGRTAQYAGAITLIAFAAMAHAAAKFNTEVTLAATQVGNNFQQVQSSAKQMGRGILAQMRQFPASAQEMTKASYDIYSSLTLQGNAQQQTAEGLKILTIFNRAAVAGQAKLSDVTNAGITILNQFGKTADGTAVQVSGLNKMMDQAFAAVRFGRETFTEFTTTLANAAPAAKAAHQSFANMAGTLAFLTRRLPVRQASVAYARLLEVLQRSGQGLAEHGVKLRDQAGFMRPLDKIIKDIAKHFPELAKGRRFAVNFFKEITKGSGTGTMGTIQARRALVFLVQQQKQYQHVLHQTTHDQGEFWKSFRALRATPEVKWRIFINQLHALAIEIGQYTIPALIKMLAPIARAVKWFESLSNSTKRHIAILGVWVGGLTLVGGTLALIIGTFTRIISTIATFGSKIKGSAAITGTLAEEAGSVSLVLARGMGLLVAIPLLIKYHHEVGMVINKLGGVKAILGIIATYLTIRLVQAYAIAAASAVRAGVAIVLAETAMGTAAEGAAFKVDALKLSLIGLSKIGPIAVAIGIYETFHHAKGITNFLKKNVPGYKALGDAVDRHVGFLRRLDQQHGLLAPGEAGTSFAVKGGPQNPYKPGSPLYEAWKRGAMGQKLIRPTVAKAKAWELGHEWMRRITPPTAAQANKKAIEDRKKAVAAQIVHNKTVQDYIRLAIQANKYAKAHPHDLQAQIRAARIMDQIQKKYKGAELAGIQAVISADNAATKKRISNAKQVADSVVSNLRQIYDQLQQQNQAALGDITQGTRIQNAMQWGGVPRAKDILADMRDQINKFRRWRRELEKLSKRGIPFALLQQLEAAGPESEPLLRGILSMNRKQFVRFTSMFRMGQRLVKTATVFDFNRQLQDWRSHGRRAAIQFMKGMKDENSYINKQMRQIFMNWMKGGNMRLRTPPRGTHPGHTARDRHIPRTHHRPHQHTRHLTIHEGDININGGNASATTSYRKARLIQKNRRANRLNWGTV